MKVLKFEDLSVWQESRDLVKIINTTINNHKNFKKDYKLVSQILSAAISVMSNIAEGFSRNSNKEFIRFLYISKGSIAEVQSISYVLLDLNYINDKEFETIYQKSEKVAKMCSNLIKYLTNSKKFKLNNSLTL